jgi:hypothetical protein
LLDLRGIDLGGLGCRGIQYCLRSSPRGAGSLALRLERCVARFGSLPGCCLRGIDPGAGSGALGARGLDLGQGGRDDFVRGHVGVPSDFLGRRQRAMRYGTDVAIEEHDGQVRCAPHPAAASALAIDGDVLGELRSALARTGDVVKDDRCASQHFGGAEHGGLARKSKGRKSGPERNTAGELHGRLLSVSEW